MEANRRPPIHGMSSAWEASTSRCLRRILDIHWQDRVTNTEVLEKADSLSMDVILCKRRLRWLGHVHRMEDGRIPKDVLYVELAMGTRPTERRYKQDIKLTGIYSSSCGTIADDRSH